MKKKILSQLLMLTVVFSMFAFISVNVYAVNEVKLLSAQVTGKTFGLPPNHGDFFGYVEVADLAYDKDVTIYYWNNSTNTWQTTSANYVADTDATHEAWYFDVHIDCPDGWWKGSLNVRFAIEYEVNGQTYWDNNNGNDYWLSQGYDEEYPSVLLEKSVTILDKGTVDNSNYFWGDVFLKDLAYTKSVVIRYTTNNWATYTDLNATYDSDVPNTNSSIEKWHFTTASALPTGTTEVKFCICYTVNGNNYWDNNFGANYEIDVPGTISTKR